MARGITEEQVHQAADAIVARGERPTIERIRAELGRGSPNTVNRHLDAWWAQLPKRLAPQIDDLPSEVVDLARKVWHQVLPRAMELTERRLRDTASALEARRVRLEEDEAKFAQERIALDRRIGELEAEAATQGHALHEAQLARKSLLGELETARAEALSIKASLGEIEMKHAVLTSKLSERLAGTERRLMERLAEEKSARDLERAAATKRLKDLQGELSALREDNRLHQAGASLAVELKSELDSLRKLLTAPSRRGQRGR